MSRPRHNWGGWAWYPDRKAWMDRYGLIIGLGAMASWCHDTGRDIAGLRNHRTAVDYLHSYVADLIGG